MTIGDASAPYPNGTSESALVGEGTTWVEWNGRVYEASVTTEEATFTWRTLVYGATRVADSAEAFRAHVAETYLTTLDGLSSGARSVLDAAKSAGRRGYEDCNEPSAGYEALRRRLENVPRTPERHRERWYVAYDDERRLSS